MWRVLEGRLIQRPLATFNATDFFTDGQHRIAKTIQLGLIFRFGGFHHQGAGHRKADCRRMKAVVHQALGDVAFGHARGGLDCADIQNAFMRDTSLCAGIQHRILRAQTRGNVVGVEDGDFGGVLHAAGAEQRDVHPGNRQDGCRSPGGGGDCALVVLAGQEGCQVCLDANRPHAGAATAVRDGEGLVQIDVRHIRADVGRAREADLRIEVRTVHVDLAAVRMDHVANLADRFFEHAVRRWVGEHQAGQCCRMLGGFGAQVGQVDIAFRVTCHSDHVQSAHLRGGRVGAMR